MAKSGKGMWPESMLIGLLLKVQEWLLSRGETEESEQYQTSQDIIPEGAVGNGANLGSAHVGIQINDVDAGLVERPQCL